MAEPVTAAAVEAKESEVKNLARKLAEATNELAGMTARHHLDSALAELDVQPITPLGVSGEASLRESRGSKGS